MQEAEFLQKLGELTALARRQKKNLLEEQVREFARDQGLSEEQQKFVESYLFQQGIRIGGPGRNRSAIQIAGERSFRDFREDHTLDLRQFQVALRRLRQFSALDDGPKPVSMVVNRPFLVVIAEEETGAVCFAGAVVNPAA